MSGKIEISRELLDCWLIALNARSSVTATIKKMRNELRALLAASDMSYRIKSAACDNCASSPCICSEIAAPVGERQPVDAILLENCVEVTIQDYGRGYFATDDCVTQLYASPPAPVSVDERAEFEAWYLGKFCGGQARLFRCVNADQIYYFAEVQSKWDAWQARACLDKVKELNQ